MTKSITITTVTTTTKPLATRLDPRWVYGHATLTTFLQVLGPLAHVIYLNLWLFPISTRLCSCCWALRLLYFHVLLLLTQYWLLEEIAILTGSIDDCASVDRTAGLPLQPVHDCTSVDRTTGNPTQLVHLLIVPTTSVERTNYYLCLLSPQQQIATLQKFAYRRPRIVVPTTTSACFLSNSRSIP